MITLNQREEVIHIRLVIITKELPHTSKKCSSQIESTSEAETDAQSSRKVCFIEEELEHRTQDSHESTIGHAEEEADGSEYTSRSGGEEIGSLGSTYTEWGNVSWEGSVSEGQSHGSVQEEHRGENIHQTIHLSPVYHFQRIVNLGNHQSKENLTCNRWR